MKISKRTNQNGILKQPVSENLDAVVERMGSKVNNNAGSNAMLLFGATFGRGGINDVRTMTGLLLISTVEAPMQTVSQWQRQVMTVPYTVLAFRSSNRRSLNIVVRVAQADGQEPENAETYMQLLTSAQRQAVCVYSSMTGCQLKAREISIDMGCPFAFDPNVTYHPEAQPMPVATSDWQQENHSTRLRMGRNGNIHNEADDEAYDQMQLEFYTCMQRAQEQYPDDESQTEQQLVALATCCRKAHLEEEACVVRTLWDDRYQHLEDLVRKIFRTTYARGLQGIPTSQMNQKERIARAIRDFFARRYKLRFNEVKNQVEFRPNDLNFGSWQPMTDRDLRRIAFEEMMEGGQGWMVDIELYVNSSLVPRYNPILEFLANVGEWDKKHNYIEDFARRLKTNYDRWPHFFHRWMLAMVAQALNKNRDHGNSMVPLLIGQQAMKKSTFCKNILPYSMRDYYMDDIKMDNAEQVERVLGRMWLVNIDEYNAKTEREQAKIKRLLTEKDIQVRHMRSEHYTSTKRLSSFIATTNERHPLTDPTGSRRYLCVEMTGQADMSGIINYQQMYAQAVWEIEHGEQYWFDNQDEREIVQHNAQYQATSAIENVLSSIYIPAAREARFFLTTTDLLRQLRKSLTAADVPTLARLGRTLKHMQYPEGAISGVHGYYMRQR